MTSVVVDQPVSQSGAVLYQATYNALENQVVIALETGNLAEAKRVFSVARGELALDEQIKLVDLARNDYEADLL